MGRWSRIGLIVSLLLALAVAFVVTRGSLPVTPNPPGTFSFGALGDAPYYAWEGRQYQRVLESVAAHDLSFVIHVGDIFWHPCSADLYRQTLHQMNDVPEPVIYTPGDNEWADCWEVGSGGYSPRERLTRLRRIFFVTPTHSLGKTQLPLVNQSQSAPFAEFVENARWEHGGVVFATVHLVGSMNAMESFPGRTAADDTAAARRTRAATAWMHETFVDAKARNAPAVVIAFHASPAFEAPVTDHYRSAYEPFMAALEEDAAAFQKPVLIIHGDDHTYTVDHPLVSRATGRRLANLTRLEVPGSPRVGWVRIVVALSARSPFSFKEYVIPRWRYW